MWLQGFVVVTVLVCVGFCYVLFLFWDIVALCSLGLLGTSYVDQAVLIEVHLPLPLKCQD